VVEVHGHRGARALFPENTIAGFLYAIQTGCDAIEFDVLATRDDVLVACHDPVLKRRVTMPRLATRTVRMLALEELLLADCGSRRNRRFPRQAITPGARIPTLREIFELAPLGRFGFDVEIKCFPQRPHYAPPPGRIAELLVAEIERACVGERVTVLSFDFRVLRAVRRIAPGIRVAALYEFGTRGFVSIADEAEAGIVAPYHRLATPRRVQAAHCAGIRVLPWTANRPRDWRRLIRAGVDGIITDDPAALIRYIAESACAYNKGKSDSVVRNLEA
jgi:glycerophosphoryl diester phosphodiesterase